ncbi:MAG: CoA-transferase [Sulfolobaceae archaeon]
MNNLDFMIKGMAELLDDGEIVYIGLNSFLPLISSIMARDYYKKKIRIVGVAEAYNPVSIVLKASTGDPSYAEGTPIFPTYEAFDLAQKGKLDVMFFGPAQIDKETNVNISVIGSYEKPKVRLPGGAATAFLMPLVNKLILWNTKHSRRTLVNKVDFVTGTAKYSQNKVFLVTNKCIMEYDRIKKVWKLVALYPSSTIEEIINETEFQFAVEKPRIIKISESESEFIKNIDPYSLRTVLEF